MRRYVSYVAAGHAYSGEWAFIASKSESHGGSVMDKLSLPYDDR